MCVGVDSNGLVDSMEAWRWGWLKGCLGLCQCSFPLFLSLTDGQFLTLRSGLFVTMAANTHSLLPLWTFTLLCSPSLSMVLQRRTSRSLLSFLLAVLPLPASQFHLLSRAVSATSIAAPAASILGEIVEDSASPVAHSYVQPLQCTTLPRMGNGLQCTTLTLMCNALQCTTLTRMCNTVQCTTGEW